MNKLEVRAQILSCTSCDLSGRVGCTAPVPFSGTVPSSLGVVGEAPGFKEDQQGAPFVGPSGQLLRASLEKTGFDMTSITYMNAASCFPVDFEGKGRAPNDVEVAACSKNLADQMALSEAKFFLLTGGVPLKAVRPGLKIGKARGVPFMLGSTARKVGDITAMATYHPSYVLRSGGEGSEQHKMMLDDLKFLLELMNTPVDDRFSMFPDTCIECDEYVERFDDDGIAWCEKHWRA